MSINEVYVQKVLRSSLEDLSGQLHCSVLRSEPKLGGEGNSLSKGVVRVF